MSDPIRAPFPYFGGKSRAAPAVWERLGNVARYVEPFAGSLAVLLARPRPFSGREFVNDSDGLLVNVWRALAADPEAVARHADWPATENDLHARHAWLVGHREDITRRLEGDPDWFDPKAAGWWLWGIGLWIGSGWCSGDGPWRVDDGQLLHAGDDGQGVHRQLLHAGDDGRGVARIVGWRADTLLAAFAPVAERMRDVMVTCGDWSRVTSDAVLFGSGKGRSGAGAACGVLLDPPYPHAETSGAVYAHDDADLAHAVRAWAIERGDDPRLRIALCGYWEEMPAGWTAHHWRTKGGYARTARAVRNRSEVVWFSPHCQRVGLFDGVTA